MSTAQKALNNTDTATLREKHYEECAVICNQQGLKLRSGSDHLGAYNCDFCADKIRAAAKENSK